MCMIMYSCVYKFIRVHVYIEARGQHQDIPSFSLAYLPYISKKGFLPKLGACRLARITGWQAPGLILSPEHWGYRCALLHPALTGLQMCTIVPCTYRVTDMHYCTQHLHDCRGSELRSSYLCSKHATNRAISSALSYFLVCTEHFL